MNPTTDRFTIRTIVIGLLMITFAVIVALVIILLEVALTTEQQGSIISGLRDLAVFAAGGVVGLLAHTASPEPVPAPQPGQPVNVPVLGGNVQVGPMPEPVVDVQPPVEDPLPPPAGG